MGRYDRYILSQLLVLFGFFSLVLISVYWVNRAVDLFGSILADGQSLAVFVEFMALSLPRIMLLVLPVSGFVAVLYIFSRLISESEMVVLQTSGFSPLQLLRPVFTFGLLLAALIAVSANVLTPAARAQLNERSSEISLDLTGQFLRAGEFLHPAEGLTVFIREITEIGELRELFLQTRDETGAETTYSANWALLVESRDGPRLVMFDGMAQIRDPETGRLSVVQFDDFTYDLAGLVDITDDRPRDIRELPTQVLLFANDETAAIFGSTALNMQFTGHARIVRTLFAFFMPVVGAAAMMIGSFSRFGAWPQVLLAVVLIIPLQITANFTAEIARGDIALMWVPYLQPAAAALTVAVLAMIAGSRKKARRGLRRQPA